LLHDFHRLTVAPRERDMVADHDAIQPGRLDLRDQFGQAPRILGQMRLTQHHGHAERGPGHGLMVTERAYWAGVARRVN
jgi:hypothetical protein